MLKNSGEKELDTFEQEMEYRIANMSAIMNSQSIDLDYYVGKVRGFKYALALYRECREADK